MSRKQVIEAAKPAHNWIKEWRNVNNSDTKSPELSKKGKGKQLKSPQSHPPEVLVDLPDTAVNSKGVTGAVHQFLEVTRPTKKRWRLGKERRVSEANICTLLRLSKSWGR